MTVQSSKAIYITETLALTADTNSAAVDTRYLSAVSFQVTWSGLAITSSTIDVEASNDAQTWCTIAGPYDDLQTALATTSGSAIWTSSQPPARYLRLSYTANGNSAGSATLVVEGRRVAQ